MLAVTVVVALAAIPPPVLAPLHTLPERAQDSRFPELEQLYSDDKPEEGLKRAEALLVTHPQDVELLVLAARFVYEIGERHKRDAAFDKVGLYTKMVRFLEMAQARAPNDARVGWGLGVAKARLSTTKGVLSSLSMAKDVEALWLRAAEAEPRYTSLKGEENLPCDAHLTLGVFYRLLPDWWLVQMVAGTRGDIDKALVWLNRAVQCAPDTIRSRKELGVAYLCAAERKSDAALRAQAAPHFAHALALSPVHETERIDQRHIRVLQAQPQQACAYSRDGQQKLDEAAVPAKR